MRYNKNLDSLQKYVFAEFYAGKRQLEQQGINVIDLGVGDPDLPTPNQIAEAAVAELKNYHGYPAYSRKNDLKKTLAEYHKKRFGINCSPEEFSIGNGAKTDLFDIGRAFSNPNDTMIIQAPTYPVYEAAAIIDGRKVKHVTCTEKNNYNPVPSEELTKKELAEAAVAFYCYPNNPTGAVADKKYLKRLVDDAHSYQFTIVYDNAYADFSPGGKPFAPSIFEIKDAEEVAIEIGSFSKPWSMTGYRLSWTMSKGKINSIWSTYRSNRDSGISLYIQRAGVEALENPEVAKQVEKNMKEYGERAKILEEGIKKSGFRCNKINHTPYAWINAGENSRKFSKRMLEKAHVIVTPGDAFGPGGESYVRATIFQPKEKLREAIERIGKI